MRARINSRTVMRSVRQSRVKVLVFWPEAVSSWIVSVVDINSSENAISIFSSFVNPMALQPFLEFTWWVMDSCRGLWSFSAYWIRRGSFDIPCLARRVFLVEAAFTLPTVAVKTWRAQRVWHGKILETVGSFKFERRRVFEAGRA